MAKPLIEDSLKPVIENLKGELLVAKAEAEQKGKKVAQVRLCEFGYYRPPHTLVESWRRINASLRAMSRKFFLQRT